jgi:hypothetical protein
MSSGGVFKLLTNDGKADRLLQATKLLNQRIQDIMCARQQANKADPTPTLADLERTHIIHVNAHFKPFAAIGYEYNKVRPQTGNPQLGNEIQFSIPQFGDFFHDMVCRLKLSSFWSSQVTSPDARGTVTGAYGIQNSYPLDGNDWNNNATLDNAIYRLVDPFGNSVINGTMYRNLVRYCEYPGERLFSHVYFTVNGNPLDDYSDVVINMIRKFTIGSDKIAGYKRLVGQEMCMEGHSGPQMCRVQDTHRTNPGQVQNSLSLTDYPLSAGAVNGGNLSNTDASAALQTPEEFLTSNFPENQHDSVQSGTTTAQHANPPLYFDVSRQCLQAANGPQTPKYWQPPLEIWNKLRFWFNDDPRLAVPSVSIPFGQRFITIQLAQQNALAFEFPGLFVEQSVVQTGLPGADVDNGNIQVRYRPYWLAGNISDISLSNVELYVNNIFVNPEIHDIFIKRVGFSLIRVYRFHSQTINKESSDEALLSQLKWPIEYMFIGIRPSWNTNNRNPNQHRDWHRFSKVVDLECNNGCYCISPPFNTVGDTPEWTEGFGSESSTGQIVPDTYAAELPVVDTVTLTAHGINIHEKFPELFFNSYVPFHYGGPAINTPDDRGVMMINFCLYPGSYQPSGHINVSRAREFYLNWTTNYFSSNTTGSLHVVAIALNFLLISDGSAVLRYST